MQTPLKKTFPNPQYLQRSRKHDSKCVCQLCTCGKHKCPERGYRIQTETTNNFYYKPYAISPQVRPKNQQKFHVSHYDPDTIKSGYNTSYTPYKIAKDRPMTAKPQYKPSTSPFQAETEYSKNYIPNRLKTEVPMTSPRKEYIPNTAKFQGQTTYKRQFSPKKADNSPISIKRKDQYKPNKIPFQGQTTYSKQYKRPQLDKSPTFKPQPFQQSRFNPSNAKFEGQSRYKQTYKQHPLQFKQPCPNEYLPQRPIRCSPGKNHIYYKASGNYWE